MTDDPPRVSALYIYPIKSLVGVSLTECAVGTTGFQLDRRWMLVDQHGKFMSQRQFPQLSLISLALDNESIQLVFPNQRQCQIPLKGEQGVEVQVRIWRDQCVAYGGYDHLDVYFREYLKQTCHLVYMPDQSKRLVDPNYTNNGADRIGFADGFPYLLVTEESLADVNNRLIQQGHAQIPITRFRPNIVISGVSSAFAEDTWDRIAIGSNLFTVAKSCSRCVMITVDSEQGVHTKEPLQTLLRYRKQNGKVYFGQNLIHRPGAPVAREKALWVRVNDPVKIQAYK